MAEFRVTKGYGFYYTPFDMFKHYFQFLLRNTKHKKSEDMIDLHDTLDVTELKQYFPKRILYD